MFPGDCKSSVLQESAEAILRDDIQLLIPPMIFTENDYGHGYDGTQLQQEKLFRNACLLAGFSSCRLRRGFIALATAGDSLPPSFILHRIS
jgi:hypothetical protein